MNNVEEFEKAQETMVEDFLNEIYLYCEENNISPKAVHITPVHDHIELVIDAGVAGTAAADYITKRSEAFEVKLKEVALEYGLTFE